MSRESDRKCLNHARVHESAQSFDRCEARTQRKTSVLFDFYDVNMSTKAELTVNFLAFPSVNYFCKFCGIVTTYIPYKMPHFC